jgi:hypothetical protein
VAFVQATSNITLNNSSVNGTSVATSSITMVATDAVVVLVSVGGDLCAAMTVADGTNTYTLAAQLYDGTDNQCTAMFYALNVAGGSRAITATFVDTTWRSIAAVEYSGVLTSAASDATPVTSNATAATWTTPTITTTLSTDLIVAGLATHSGSPATNTPTGAANERVDALPPLVMEDVLSSGTTTITGTLNVSVRLTVLGIALKKA